MGKDTLPLGFNLRKSAKSAANDLQTINLAADYAVVRDFKSTSKTILV
jgi:hypothetical protein